MWGQILSAVAGPAIGLAGKLIGGSGPEPVGLGQHLEKVVEKSQKNGFNPLTVLRSGAGAPPQTFHSPTAGVFDYLADAASNIGAVYETDRQEKAQLAIMREQLNARQSSSVFPGGGFQMSPTTAGAAPYTGAPIVPEMGKTTSTNPYGVGSLFHVNPMVPDAESFTQHFGDSELFSTIGGVKTLWHDYTHNMGRLSKHVSEEYEGSKVEKIVQDYLAPSQAPSDYEWVQTSRGLRKRPVQ